ncbi:MAG: beta-ketoacyl synthase N-terminal-like domain-containing protein [Myxococcota bacterium]
MKQPEHQDVWVTGVGLVTSLGIGLEATWSSLLEGQSGLSTSEGLTEAAYVRCPAIAKLAKFRGNRYLKNRKSIKLMTRPVQLGMAAAKLAFEGAGLQEDQLDPERFGVFVGAGQAFADRRELETALDRSRTEKGFDMVAFGTQGMDMIHPLWMLLTPLLQ